MGSPRLSPPRFKPAAQQQTVGRQQTAGPEQTVGRQQTAAPDTPARKNTVATRRRPPQNAPAVAHSAFNARARLPPAALVVYRNHNI
jgi:hypothetical protein